MRIKKLDGFGSYGSVVEDINLNSVTKDEWYKIKKVHSESLLTIIRLEEKIDYLRYVFLIKDIGTSDYSVKKFEKLSSIISPEKLQRSSVVANNFLVDPEYNTLQRITALKDNNNVPLGAFGDGELLWHSNGSGSLDFTPGVALMGVQDMEGTATGFVQTADFYEGLSESFKSELKEMVVVHNFKEGTINPVPVPDQELIFKLGMCLEDNVRIPLVIKSPSDIVGLHLGLNTFDYIEGMSKEESNRFLNYLKSHLFTEKYIYDYWWENDQNILLFDNSITLHRRLLNKNSCESRIAYRIAFRYESLCGYYNPYFQKEFNDLKKSMDDVTW